MKKAGFFKERIFPILFMLIITAVCITIVSYIHLSTKEIVALNETLFLKKAVLFAASIQIPEDSQDVVDLYGKRIREVKTGGDEIKYFSVLDEETDQVKGYVVFQDGAGLWGEITAVIGYEKDLATLTGIDFIKQNETPGLGARIMEEWFRRQFKGKRPPLTMVPEDAPAGEKEFDAITGATRTSSAVMKILNSNAQNVQSIVTMEKE